jgi:hypothetical protein
MLLLTARKCMKSGNEVYIPPLGFERFAYCRHDARRSDVHRRMPLVRSTTSLAVCAGHARPVGGRPAHAVRLAGGRTNALGGGLTPSS